MCHIYSILPIPDECVHGLKPHLGRLDQRDDGDELQNYLQEKTGQRSVPNIFISTLYINSQFHG